MGNSLFGGLFKVTAAAAAVAGIAYLFKDEIKGTEAYQTLNTKYDVDTKLSEAAKKAKEAAYVAKDKAKDAAFTAKDKAKEAYKKSPWASASDEDIFEDDEIVLNEDGVESTRDYVEIKTDEAAEAVDAVKEEAAEAVDAVKEGAAEAADAAADTVASAVEKLDDVIKSVEEQANNIEID